MINFGTPFILLSAGGKVLTVFVRCSYYVRNVFLIFEYRMLLAQTMFLCIATQLKIISCLLFIFTVHRTPYACPICSYNFLLIITSSLS